MHASTIRALKSNHPFQPFKVHVGTRSYRCVHPENANLTPDDETLILTDTDYYFAVLATKNIDAVEPTPR